MYWGGQQSTKCPVTWLPVVPEGAFWEGSELVEEWSDDDRVDCHHKEGNNQDEKPEVQRYQGARVLQNHGDCSYDGGQKQQSKRHLQHMATGAYKRHICGIAPATTAPWTCMRKGAMASYLCQGRLEETHMDWMINIAGRAVSIA